MDASTFIYSIDDNYITPSEQNKQALGQDRGTNWIGILYGIRFLFRLALGCHIQ